MLTNNDLVAVGLISLGPVTEEREIKRRASHYLTSKEFSDKWNEEPDYTSADSGDPIKQLMTDLSCPFLPRSKRYK